MAFVACLFSMRQWNVFDATQSVRIVWFPSRDTRIQVSKDNLWGGIRKMPAPAPLRPGGNK